MIIAYEFAWIYHSAKCTDAKPVQQIELAKVSCEKNALRSPQITQTCPIRDPVMLSCLDRILESAGERFIYDSATVIKQMTLTVSCRKFFAVSFGNTIYRHGKSKYIVCLMVSGMFGFVDAGLPFNSPNAVSIIGKFSKCTLLSTWRWLLGGCL